MAIHRVLPGTVELRTRGKWGLRALLAVGLFDVQGLADVYPSLETTAPVVDKITFHLPNEKEFGLQTKFPAGKDNACFQSVLLTGKPWNSFEFPFRVFANGGGRDINLGS